MKRLLLEALEEDGIADGSCGWQAWVDGEPFGEPLSNDELNLNSTSLDLIWEKLGIDVSFTFKTDDGDWR